MFTKILGTGSYLPAQIRSNADLEKMVDTSDEWIVTRTGIRERRIASADETVSSMGRHAAELALNMAGIEAEKVGMVIVATTSPSHAFPSSACQIQRDLGINDCIAFDMAAACAGFAYALGVADTYMWGGKHFWTLRGNDGLAGSPLLARLTVILRILDSSQKNERKMIFLHYILDWVARGLNKFESRLNSFDINKFFAILYKIDLYSV